MTSALPQLGPKVCSSSVPQLNFNCQHSKQNSNISKSVGLPALKSSQSTILASAKKNIDPSSIAAKLYWLRREQDRKIRESLAAAERDEKSRTQRCIEFARNIQGFNPKDMTLEIARKKFTLLTRAKSGFLDSNTVSCGSSLSRELITFDPKNIPENRDLRRHLITLKKDLLARMKSGAVLTTKLILERIKHLIQHDILTEHRTYDLAKVLSKAKYDSVSKRSIKYVRFDYGGRSETLIGAYPLNFFVKHKIGVCRHYAFIFCVIADFAKTILNDKGKPILEGTTMHFRDDLKGSPHTLALFIPVRSDGSEIEKWLVDATPSWNRLNNFADEKERQALEKVYSAEMVKHILESTEAASKENGQV